MFIQTIKITFKNSIVYRFNTIMSIMATVFTLFLQLLLWQALLDYRTVSIITFEQMVVYQTVGVVLSLFYNANIADAVGNRIKDGSIAYDLIKPFRFSAYMIAYSIGSTIFDFVIRGVIVVTVVYFTYGFHFAVSLTNLLLFVVVLAMNFFLFWLLHYIIGLLHFILLSANWFTRILRDTISILGGGIIPLWFFPESLKAVAMVLPFQLLYQFPLSLLIGKLSPEQIIRNFGLSAIWIGILVGIALLLWRHGTKKLVIQGG